MHSLYRHNITRTSGLQCSHQFYLAARTDVEFRYVISLRNHFKELSVNRRIKVDSLHALSLSTLSHIRGYTSVSCTAPVPCPWPNFTCHHLCRTSSRLIRKCDADCKSGIKELWCPGAGPLHQSALIQLPAYCVPYTWGSQKCPTIIYSPWKLQLQCLL
jgi:hypothetical protein